jgi:hypothetical protein
MWWVLALGVLYMAGIVALIAADERRMTERDVRRDVNRSLRLIAGYGHKGKP